MSITPGLLRLLGEAAEFVIVVLRHQAGVVADDALGLTEGCCDAPLHRAEVVAVVAFGCAVHRLDMHHRQTLWCGQAVIVVREPRERQTLQEGTHLARHLAKIDGRAKRQAVRIGNLV